MTVRSFFNWCVDQDLCEKNPAVDVRMSRLTEQATKPFADRPLVARLIKKAPNDDMRFILYCGFHAGMRRLEIVEARPSWFKLAHGHVEISTTETFRPKDRQTRTVPLSEEFSAFLKKYGLREPFVLHPDEPHGLSRYRYDFRRPFTDFMKAQKVPWITPHIMRHSFASCCAIAGVDIFRIATWLGDGIRVTQKHYAKLLPNDRAIDKVF
jgi:integrase